LTAEYKFESKIIDLKVVGDWVMVGLFDKIYVFYFDDKEYGINCERSMNIYSVLPSTRLNSRGLIDLHVDLQRNKVFVVFPIAEEGKNTVSRLCVAIYSDDE
jgi:hypothetical protein